MKAQVLFDKKGKVIGVLHLLSEFSLQQGPNRQPMFVLIPGPGQQQATLRIPPELESLSPVELHASVKVEMSGESPRLVAREKRGKR